MKYLFLLFLFPVILSAQVVEPIWTVHETFKASRGNGNLSIMTIDSAHNTIVCGASYHPGPVLGFVTTKYDQDGNKLWDAKHDTYGQDIIKSVITDPTNAVYVGGNAINVVTYKEVFKVFKYSPEGDTLWQYIYEPNKPEISSNIAQLILTPEQNILVVAGVYNALIQESKLLLVCLNPEGTVVWETSYKEEDLGYGAFGARLMDGYYAVWAKKGYGFAYMNVGLDGTITTVHPTPGYFDYYGTHTHIGRDGSLYLGDESGQYKVTKFDTLGNLAWVYEKPHFPVADPFFSAGSLYLIDTDLEGNVYASGVCYIDSITGRKSITSRLSPAGLLEWEHIFYSNSPETTGKYGALAQKSHWINDSIISFANVYTTDTISNNFTYSITYYKKSGFISGGVTFLDYARNSPTDMLYEGGDLYICGLSQTPNGDRQFLSKHTLSQYLTSDVSEGGGDKVQPITIQPNPSGGNAALVIDWVGAATQGITEVFNIQGQGISAEIMQLSPGKNILPLRSAAQLPKGIYPVTLKVGGQFFAGKLVIQ